MRSENDPVIREGQVVGRENQVIDQLFEGLQQWKIEELSGD